MFFYFRPDTRPGLAPKHVARVNGIKKKEKVSNEKNKLKPKAVLEKERRDEGLSAAISNANKGFSLMAKMGFKPGMALGKSGIVILQLLQVSTVSFFVCALFILLYIQLRLLLNMKLGNCHPVNMLCSSVPFKIVGKFSNICA